MINSVPDISETIVIGTHDIVGKVVYGSTNMIRCVWYGAPFMAATVVVSVCHPVMGWFSEEFLV